LLSIEVCTLCGVFIDPFLSFFALQVNMFFNECEFFKRDLLQSNIDD